MLKVGITGQVGFVGTHLYNTLGLYKDKYERIPFEDNYFNDKKKFDQFISSCDVVIHLAAMNRHHDPEVIYNTNISLVKKLIEACESSNSKPHILFSSSTQEERDNLYGKSKKVGRQLFENWAKKNDAHFTGLIIPNVFGPFGNPYYNSVVATFCHQLTHNEMPKIETDSEMNLIYVAELVHYFLNKIEIPSCNKMDSNIEQFEIPHTSTIKVSELLELLKGFKERYFENGMIPNLNNPFERNLFNTLLTCIDHQLFFPFHLKLNTDKRGSFIKRVKLNNGGQVSFTTTKPGIDRGNHFHPRKAERFAVIKGKALIEYRRIGTAQKFTFELDGNNHSFVDMPVCFTHNITNIRSDEVYNIFWISEHYDSSYPDTFFELV